jgi:hypothetical protein
LQRKKGGIAAKLYKFAFFGSDRQENAPQIAKTSWK